MPKFYANTHGALVVYSITDRNSFEAVNDWLDELKRQTYCRFIMLVGNKNDLEEERAVSRSEGQEFAAKHDLLFMETSAKLSTNVDEAFSAVIKDIFDDATNPARKPYDDANDEVTVPTSKPVVLTDTPAPTTTDKKGCAC